MLFNSLEFLLFLLLSLVLYYGYLFFSRDPKVQVQNILLLVLSYGFYAFWNSKFCLLLAASTLIDYWCGLKIREVSRNKRKFLYFSLISNLGILSLFKYFNFFSDSFADLIRLMGMDPHLPVLDVILPVGISFYTFQSMAYTIDIYRGKIQPTRSLISYSVYVSFFPQLVAGPIERAAQLIPQIEKLKSCTRQKFWEGLSLISSGFVRKVFISDQIATISDNAFLNWQWLDSSSLLEGLVVFSFVIYFDFSGYSEIARGTAKFLGVDLMENFRQPYFSQSIKEFWRRWHISLSTWLRDYLYIPLGGNRRGSGRNALNLMATMCLGGLWHGANITFVVWGMLHGSYLALGRVIPQISLPPYVKVFFNVLLTHICVLLTWIFFRAETVESAFGYLSRLIVWAGGVNFHKFAFIGLLYGLLFLLDWPAYKKGVSTYFLEGVPRPLRIIVSVIIFVIVIVLVSNPKSVRPFIYFQF